MAARLTQADITRAIRAARREGCPIVELGGEIRIYVDPQGTDKTPPVNPADLLDE